jgi:hypothetical protein
VGRREAVEVSIAKEYEERIVKLFGQDVIRVRRMYYDLHGKTDRTQGAVELTFRGGGVIFIDTKSDWSILVDDTSREDPFSGELSPDNAEYVRASGKWTWYDVSDVDPFLAILGGLLLNFSFGYNVAAELVDVNLEFDRILLDIKMWAGEVTTRVRER